MKHTRLRAKRFFDIIFFNLVNKTFLNEVEIQLGYAVNSGCQ
jgi:hypothetical protein